MTIHEPGRRLMHDVRLEFVKKRVVGGGGRSTNASLSLTSMIDFLVVTVVFLLMTFSASGEVAIPKDVKLPSAENATDMVDAPLVGVSGTQIFVNGKPVGSTRTVSEGGRIIMIEELKAALSAIRETYKQTHPGKEPPTVAILEIDGRVESLVVKSVFQTAAYSGFPNVSFMVNKTAAPK